MSEVDKLILKAELPPLFKPTGNTPPSKAALDKRRGELLRIILENEYGIMPECEHLAVEIKSERRDYFGGKAIYRELLLIATLGGKEFSFPVYLLIPKQDKPCPAFVHINFRPNVPDRIMPSEEIIDNGFACFSFCYTDVSSDDGDFSSGIAPLSRCGRRTDSSPGKIAMWAFAARRVLDYAVTLPEIDRDNIAVIGHSRLGKTALLAGALDERFEYVISNDSGCCGAAIGRGKRGETVAAITNVFPHWFCPKFVKRAAQFSECGFDQHFLLALIAPRYLMVGSAEEDEWADPQSEFLGCAAASEMFELYGVRGLMPGGSLPGADEAIDGGHILYRMRRGTHWMTRDDWQTYINYIKKSIKDKEGIKNEQS